MIKLKDHNDLVRYSKRIAARINENPAKSVLCLANPILGLHELGFEMSQELAAHVRRALPLPFVEQEVFRKLKSGHLVLRGISRLSVKITKGKE